MSELRNGTAPRQQTPSMSHGEPERTGRAPVESIPYFADEEIVSVPAMPNGNLAAWITS
jgi:hypothetical protein